MVANSVSKSKYLDCEVFYRQIEVCFIVWIVWNLELVMNIFDNLAAQFDPLKGSLKWRSGVFTSAHADSLAAL